MTPGVDALSIQEKDEVFRKVRDFGYFTDGNDPYGEHDFGAFEIEGCQLFWKISYYDEDLGYGSEDPSDPAKTTRVLTIMRAEEY